MTSVPMNKSALSLHKTKLTLILFAGMVGLALLLPSVFAIESLQGPCKSSNMDIEEITAICAARHPGDDSAQFFCALDLSVSCEDDGDAGSDGAVSTGDLPFEEYNSPPEARRVESQGEPPSHPICPGRVGNLTLDLTYDIREASGMKIIECSYVETRYIAGHYQTYKLASFGLAWAEDQSVAAGIKGQLCMPSYIGWDEWSDNGKAASVTDVYLHDDLIGLKDELKIRIKEGLGKAEARAIGCPGRTTAVKPPEEVFSEADFEGLVPDEGSCKEFGVAESDFDLAYDDAMLRKEFRDFLKDYGSKNKLKSASYQYAGWDPLHFLGLGAFMFSTDVSKIGESVYSTGTEDELFNRINERFQRTSTPLTPAQLFEEALILNDNHVYDALLTSHNLLKREGYALRRQRGDQNLNSTLLNTRSLIADREQRLRDVGLLDPDGNIVEIPNMNAATENDITELRQFRSDLDDLLRPGRNFEALQEVRTTDNEGAWYHLFGTLTTGYAERENTWRWFGDTAYTRSEVFGEHRVYKGILEGRGRAGIDLPEYCWDVWGGYLGGEIYNMLTENRERVKKSVMEHETEWKNAVPNTGAESLRKGFQRVRLLDSGFG